jgi:hypothetical protein
MVLVTVCLSVIFSDYMFHLIFMFEIGLDVWDGEG